MRHILVLIFVTFSVSIVKADSKTLRIYQDADISNHFESSRAIQLGIELAFSEMDNMIGGYKIEFKYLDHRGNVVRSKRNYAKFINDPNALAIFSGIHSPPLIKNRTYINENDALTMVPWAAGGPITRHPDPENWIFRLSIDDNQAGPKIIDFATRSKQCKFPHLMLEDTPWGDSNQKSMTLALSKNGQNSPNITRFGWNLTQAGAKALLNNVVRTGNDCLILVANAIEGKTIVNALLSLPEEDRIPIISHWGITGGDFHQEITAQKRKGLDLTFIQTCFAFTNKELNSFQQTVFDKLKNFPGSEISAAEDLQSAVGFVHAYDLTRVLIAAMKQSGLTGDMQTDRNQVRLALEELGTDVQGLIRNYRYPFSTSNGSPQSTAHEALNDQDYCMAKFGSSDEILTIQ